MSAAKAHLATLSVLLLSRSTKPRSSSTWSRWIEALKTGSSGSSHHQRQPPQPPQPQPPPPQPQPPPPPPPPTAEYGQENLADPFALALGAAKLPQRYRIVHHVV